MDLQRYTDENIIGPGNQKADCDGLRLIRDDMAATFAAWSKAITELIIQCTSSIYQDGNSKLPIILDRVNTFQVLYEELEFHQTILFNSILCIDDPLKKTTDEPCTGCRRPWSWVDNTLTPITGITTKILDHQFPGDPGPTIPYGSTYVYSPVYLQNYKEARQALLTNVKELFAFLLDIRLGSGDIAPDVPVNGYCPPYDPGQP